MNYSEALQFLKSGEKLCRAGWNGKGMWIELQVPDEHSKMTRPYVFMSMPKGSTSQFGETMKDMERVPWLCSQTDLMAEDWEIVGPTA